MHSRHCHRKAVSWGIQYHHTYPYIKLLNRSNFSWKCSLLFWFNPVYCWLSKESLISQNKNEQILKIKIHFRVKISLHSMGVLIHKIALFKKALLKWYRIQEFSNMLNLSDSIKTANNLGYFHCLLMVFFVLLKKIKFKKMEICTAFEWPHSSVHFFRLMTIGFSIYTLLLWLKRAADNFFSYYTWSSFQMHMYNNCNLLWAWTTRTRKQEINSKGQKGKTE